ncbi:MAG: DUF3330 domain-containing protein [Telluria sp.]|nr:DUF3330 domain-containing protein [Telluria sp.]
MNANDPTATSCCVYCKEIPLDAAFTPESAEYVEHFCGLECYRRFQTRAMLAATTGNQVRDCDGLTNKPARCPSHCDGGAAVSNESVALDFGACSRGYRDGVLSDVPC